MPQYKKSTWFRALSSVILFFSINAQAEPKILVSIAPLHSIVANITEGVLYPELLLDGSISPHDFQLKPSQRKLISASDLIIWVGPELETGLEKVLHISDGIKFGLHQYEDELSLLAFRQAGEDESDFIPNEHNHDISHDHEGIDPHFWLSPKVASQFAEAVTSMMAEFDSKNKLTYEANLTAFKLKLDESTNHWNKLSWTGDSKLPIVTPHDGFQYFENYMNLKLVSSIRLNSEVSPSIKSLRNTSTLIEAQGVTCALVEAQESNKHINKLIDQFGLVSVEIDTQGQGLTPGSELYFQLMDKNINLMNACFETD